MSRVNTALVTSLNFRAFFKPRKTRIIGVAAISYNKIVIKHGRHIFGEIHTVRKGLRAFFLDCAFRMLISQSASWATSSPGPSAWEGPERGGPWGRGCIPSILLQLAQGWVVLLSHKCHLLARCKSYKSIFKDVHSQGIVWWNIHIDPEVKFTAIYKKWLVKIPETRTKERTFRSDRSDWFTCH